jgi:hypothetical protein
MSWFRLSARCVFLSSLVAGSLLYAAASKGAESASNDDRASAAGYSTADGSSVNSDEPGTVFSVSMQNPPANRPRAASPKNERPATPAPRTQTPSEANLADMLSSGGSRESEYHSARLVSTPSMQGDFYNNGGQLFVMDTAMRFASTDIPLAGGCGGLTIGDNNKALTEDRVFFLYNHFQNAVTADASDFIRDPDRRTFSVDRYTFGFEKTFLDHQWSVDLRLPLAGRTAFDTSNFGVAGEDVGNVGLVLKRMICERETFGVVAGLGLELPTGSDAFGYVNVTEWRMQNEAVHLIPYVGISAAPADNLFWHTFLSVDVPTNGNTVDYSDMLIGDGTFGKYTEQTLLHLDVAGGYWFYRNEAAPHLKGMAALLEVHYTSALSDSDSLYGVTPITLFAFTGSGRVDVVDLTVGLHFELANNTVCRVGSVVPLCSAPDRTFDSEVAAQIERRF